MPAPIKLAFGLALVAFPLLEIVLLIRAGRAWGFWPVTAIVVGTAIIGLRIISRQGLRTFLKKLSQLQHGGSALIPMVDGLLVVTAGFLLVLPGLMTDVFGLILLIPQVRQLVIKAGLVKLLAGDPEDAHVFGKGGTRDSHGSAAGSTSASSSGPVYGDLGSNGVVIEGEYERIDEKPANTSGKAGRRSTSA